MAKSTKSALLYANKLTYMQDCEYVLSNHNGSNRQRLSGDHGPRIRGKYIIITYFFAALAIDWVEMAK